MTGPMKTRSVLLFVAICCCTRAGHAEPAKPARTAKAPAAAEVAYQQGMKQGWMDFGWSPRKPNPKGPELHNLKGYGGWILVREQPMNAAQAGGVSFTYKADAAFGDFIEVKLDKPGTSGRDWEKVRLGPQHLRALEGGAFEVFVPMSELNPKKLQFDRIVLFAYRDVPASWVAIDDVVLTVPGATEPVARPTGKPQRIAIDCKKKSHKISPGIYGIAFIPQGEYGSQHQWALKPTGRRWGGNHTTRYNYQLGEVWNAGADWYYRNLTYTNRPGWTWETYLEANAQKGVDSTISLPMLGWVAKDTTSFSYSVKEFPEQQYVEAETGAGNGRDKAGKFFTPPPQTRTSVESNPELISKWVKLIKEKSDKLKVRTTYILDNEPMLWDSTHHDLHPDPLGYDELWEKTQKYAAAVKKADPTASIAGPAEWGWSNYFYSTKDLKVSTMARPDRRKHGDVPLIPWYLQKLAEYEKANKVRLVDTLDLHFYPQAQGVGIIDDGDTSTEGSLRRIRSTRALWDPTYHDESWIDDTVQLIPRMKKWIAENNPGMSTQIGEWNFGAQKHISGGLAVAEALGRFGQFDLTYAYYWQYPGEGSAAYWGFRAYRDFDGKGGHFEEWSLPASAPAGSSAFASVSADGTHVVAVVLNLDPKSALLADVALDGCAEAASRKVYTYKEGAKGLEPRESKDAALSLDPFSINVVEWSLKK